MIYHSFMLVNSCYLLLFGCQWEFKIGTKEYASAYFSGATIVNVLQDSGFKVMHLQSDKLGFIPISWELWVEAR